MSEQPSQPPQGPAGPGTEIVPYRRPAAAASEFKYDQQAIIARQQKQIADLVEENKKLREREQRTATERGLLENQIRNEQNQNDLLQQQLAQTRVMLGISQQQAAGFHQEAEDMARELATKRARETDLAATIHAKRLQIPCKDRPWRETQRLGTLDWEVAELANFVDVQYQEEFMWGSEMISNPNFWYQGGGFHNRRTGPDGDGGTWTRYPPGEQRQGGGQQGRP